MISEINSDFEVQIQTETFSIGHDGYLRATSAPLLCLCRPPPRSVCVLPSYTYEINRRFLTRRPGFSVGVGLVGFVLDEVTLEWAFQEFFAFPQPAVLPPVLYSQVGQTAQQKPQFTHKHARTHTCMHACMHTYTHTYIHTRTHTHTHTVWAHYTSITESPCNVFPLTLTSDSNKVINAANHNYLRIILLPHVSALYKAIIRQCKKYIKQHPSYKTQYNGTFFIQLISPRYTKQALYKLIKIPFFHTHKLYFTFIAHFWALCSCCGRKSMGNFEFGVSWDNIRLNTVTDSMNTGVAVKVLSFSNLISDGV